MMLITKSQMGELLAASDQGMRPIVKLFMGKLTWLVTGIAPDGRVYGYADIGMQCVEWGSLCFVNELPTLKVGPAYLERDLHFKDNPKINWLEKDSLVGC